MKKQVKQMVPLKELTLMNRFLFSQAMDDPQFAEDVLSIIMDDDIVLKELPQTEKEFRNNTLRKHVKVDVWAIDDTGNIYDAEVQQKKDRKNLPKRSRYYQAMIDSRLLEEGDTNYWTMSRVHIIMIGSFDLFGRDRYVYTFRMNCVEEPDLPLNDDGYRIFLNTRGKDEENISPELKFLLKFFENPTEEMANQSNSERIKRMQKRVKTLKESEEIGVKYMREWEEKVYERMEGHAEGLAEGHAEGLAEGLAEGESRMIDLFKKLEAANRLDEYAQAMDDEELRHKLLEEFNL